MKVETKLAKVFTTLAAEEVRVESTAAAMLLAVKEAGINTIEAFDEAVQAAYAANGWNARQGRPAADSEAEDVPGTVRTYVSWIRSALRAGLRVGRFKTFHELRKALAEKRGIRAVPNRKRDDGGAVTVPKEVEQDFDGVQLATPNKTNGALFHDLAAVFVHLPPDSRSVLGRQLTRLLHTYLPTAFPNKKPARGKKATAAAA